MKLKILAVLSMLSLIGMAHAEEAPVLKNIPPVAKCMEMHQFAAIAYNSADPKDTADYERFMKENFTDEQRWDYNHTIQEWNKDPDIRATYKALRGPDIYGWALTPALQMAACVKVLDV